MRVLQTYHGHQREPAVILLVNEALPRHAATEHQDAVMIADGIALAQRLYESLASGVFDAMLTEIKRLTKPPTLPPATQETP